MKILCLHGYTQNGELFARKASAIRKLLTKMGDQLLFITAPVRVDMSDLPFEVDPATDIDMRTWWETNERSKNYFNMEPAFDELRQVLKSQGPFDGLIGFSQGAGLAAVVCQIVKELCPSHPEFQFAVFYSGFRLKPSFCDKYYIPELSTPSLHVVGTLDTVVSEERSMTLWNACKPETRHMLKHVGGHYVPSQKPIIEAVASFIHNSRQEKEEDDKIEW